MGSIFERRVWRTTYRETLQSNKAMGITRIIGILPSEDNSESISDCTVVGSPIWRPVFRPGSLDI